MAFEHAETPITDKEIGQNSAADEAYRRSLDRGFSQHNVYKEVLGEVESEQEKSRQVSDEKSRSWSQDSEKIRIEAEKDGWVLTHKDELALSRINHEVERVPQLPENSESENLARYVRARIDNQYQDITYELAERLRNMYFTGIPSTELDLEDFSSKNSRIIIEPSNLRDIRDLEDRDLYTYYSRRLVFLGVFLTKAFEAYSEIEKRTGELLSEPEKKQRELFIKKNVHDFLRQFHEKITTSELPQVVEKYFPQPKPEQESQEFEEAA